MTDRKETPKDPLTAAEFPVGGAVLGGHHPRDDEPMTDKQAAELRQLCEARGEVMDAKLTQRQAADRIAALKAR